MQRLAERTLERIAPFNEKNFIKNKTGAVRRRYLRAKQDIERYGFDIEKDSDIQAFVKLERYFDETKSPRMIMGRNPKFNILYAQFIEPIERAFFQLPEVANGKDHHAMGEQFSEMASRCRTFIENDMSKYESSQRFETLQWEYLYYFIIISRICPQLIPLLRRAYAACLKSKVKTNLGIMLAFIMCRVSGDLTTSLGNGIVNLITSIFNQVMNTCHPNYCGLDLCTSPGCRVRDIIVKGDDSVLGANAGQKFHNYYQYFGLDAKINFREDATSVEFCSGGFVESAPGRYIYVQKLQKLLESLTTCINEQAVEHGWVAQYYYSLGYMYKVVYRGVPVYEDIADFLLRTSRGKSMTVNLDLVAALGMNYNLNDAFRADHAHVEIDKSMAYLGVSLLNQMDYGELQTIRDFLGNHHLELPPSMQKRCRVRSKNGIDERALIVDFQGLNDQVLSKKVSPDFKRRVKMLEDLEATYLQLSEGHIRQ